VRQFIEKPPGKDKRWIVTIPLSTPTLFGAESLSAMRQQSDTILVHESETDAIVDRVLGVPAVATGGKDWWNAAHWNLLMGFARVVAWREDDEGARLLAKMARTRPANGPVLLVAESPDETAKDPGRLLQRHGHEEAARLIREAIAGARPWETEAIPDSRTLQDADLDNTYPPVVPFPTDVLPEPARTLVVEGAASLGVPPDFIAVPFLAVTAGMIGNTQRIQLKRGFEQRAILWDATVGQPGSGKSPAQDLACAPMEELQREAKRIFDLQYQSQLTDWEHQPKEGRGQKPEPPRMDEYYVSDATWESIAPILEHVPGLPLRRDELVAWVGSYDAYRSGRGGDRQNWLSAWSGVPIKVNRRSGNGVPIYIPDPAISVLGGIQPDLLPALVKEAGRREGFIERFLWSWSGPRRCLIPRSSPR